METDCCFDHKYSLGSRLSLSTLAFQLTQIQNGKCKCCVGKLQNRPVADPDLQISGRRAVSKTLFRPFGPQFSLRIKKDLGPQGQFPGSATRQAMEKPVRVY